ncbi:MAG: translocation/assembly module TamB, partial [Ignavibacteria bacterium]|nr:translocation/assembly module TamB [Ignavibacteria bacterium]
IPVISQLKGQMNGELDIAGIVKQPELTGNFKIDKGSFNFDMTGVNYDFDAMMTTEGRKLNFQKFAITHKSAPKKIMNMGGHLDFSNLTINEIYLVLNGEAKLLDDKVTHNIMGVYGDLYGKTGLKNIELKGNLDYLALNGDLDVTDGRILIVPQSKVAYNIYSDNFKYNVLIDSNSVSDSMFVQKMMDSVSYLDKKKLDPFQMYFFNLLDSADNQPKASNFKYMLKVKTLKDIYARLIIDEKTKQEFSGYVSTDIAIDNYNSESFSTRGRVELGKNSYYKFYKSFEASGNVLFTGDVVNPELFIEGVYETTGPDPNNTNLTRNVVINLNVTGNAMNPKLTWKVTSNRNPVGGADPTDDAISFIVFGMFKDELNANQRSSLFSSVGANVGTSFMSSYVSDLINNYLPFILKTDISYKDSPDGTFAENTDIRFTAQVAGATVIFGGQIFQDLSNTNFLIEYPIRNLIKKDNFTKNIIIQLERYVDPFSQNNIFSADNRTGGAILYRIKF